MTAFANSTYSHTLRIYWEDTDAGGVVFFVNYLKFFERARTEWLRAWGFDQERLRVDLNALFVVTETKVRYLRPAHLDDELRVTVTVQHHGQASMHIAQVAWRGEERLAESEIRIGCVDAGTFRPRRIPMELLQKIA
jgi:acyl-CoA thioester hydrolase